MKKATAVLGLIAIAAVVVSGMQTMNEGPVRHVVVFDYADDASDEQIREITDAFRALQDEIPGILSFEHGVNNSPEGLNQSYTHVYVLTFESVAARDAYLPHPEHAKFGELLRSSGIFEGAFVVDYQVSE